MYTTPRPAPPPRLPPRPSLSITPIFLPKSVTDSDQLDPIENRWSPFIPRSFPNTDQLEPVDLSLKRKPSMSVEVVEAKATPRVAPVGLVHSGSVGLAAVLEKLPLASLAQCEAAERHRREHRCEYPGCLKVGDRLKLLTFTKEKLLAGVHKELAPEGTPTHPHGGEAIRLHVARMSLVLLEER